MPLVLVTPPAIEPVTLADLKLQLGLPPGDDSDHVKSDMVHRQLRRLIAVARAECENYTRRVFITQTWKLLLDGWPAVDMRYERPGYPSIVLPKPPFQSVVSFNYVDTAGVQQDMTVYGYQTDPGSETQPARLTPPYVMPWPPIRMIPNNVTVAFKCGYGGPVPASMTQGSAVLTGPKFLPGDVGASVTVPGAGASGVALNSTIASVDGSGNATLAAVAATAVNSVTAWVGQQIPMPITQAILFLAQFFYENGAISDLPMPRIVRGLLDPYRNLVS